MYILLAITGRKQLKRYILKDEALNGGPGTRDIWLGDPATTTIRTRTIGLIFIGTRDQSKKVTGTNMAGFTDQKAKTG